MDNKLLLAKSITLLYHESKLPNNTENSSDLIRTVLDHVQVSEIGIGLNTDREVVIALKATVLEMCNNPIDHQYDRTSLLQRIRINTGDNDKLYKGIEQGILSDISEDDVKRTVLNIRSSITNHFKELKISEVISKAANTFKYQPEKIKDINNFVNDLISQLEPLQMTTDTRDPAVMDDIDIGDDTSLQKMFSDIKKINDGTKIYRTGWQDLNEALAGGIRQGECVVIGALQHKYKSGFSLSLFQQIALYNKPLTEDTNKKPLLLRISCEDPLTANIQFMYQYLRYDETREPVSTEGISEAEMSRYVKTKLQVNGFHIKMIRVDPNQWTYKSICNKVIELEAQGYNIEVLMVDYLSKIPTIGCTNVGIIGADLCDMFSRMRNFCAGRSITFISPHQLSTEVKQLIKNGMPEHELVKHVVGKGMYERTRALDVVVDTELFIHIVKHQKESYLSIMKGKHRNAPIVSEEDKYLLLPFPKKMPIPSDLESETKISFRKLPTTMQVSDDLFSL